MTLNEYKASNHPRWSDVAREISNQGLGRMYEDRLTRLRNGQVTPTEEELKALMLLTNNDVESYT